jgi:hypothetical protein
MQGKGGGVLRYMHFLYERLEVNSAKADLLRFLLAFPLILSELGGIYQFT